MTTAQNTAPGRLRWGARWFVDALLLLGAAAVSLGVFSASTEDRLGLAHWVSAPSRAGGAWVVGALLAGLVGWVAFHRGRGPWASVGAATLLLGTLLAPLDYTDAAALHPLRTAKLYIAYASASGIACAVLSLGAWRLSGEQRRVLGALAGWTATRAMAFVALAGELGAPGPLAASLIAMDGLGALALWRALSSKDVRLVAWLPVVLACVLAQPDLAAVFTHAHRAAGVTLDALGAVEDGRGSGQRLPSGLGAVSPGGRVTLLADGASVTHVAIFANTTAADLHEAARHLRSLRGLVLVLTEPSPGWVQSRVEAAESHARTARIVPLVREGDRPGFLDPRGERQARCTPLRDGPVAPQLGPAVRCIGGLPAFERPGPTELHAPVTPRYWAAFPAPTIVLLLLSAIGVAFTRRRGTRRRATDPG